MKLSKKKVIALALAVCLFAILSFSTLAWFTDQDEVTNDFMIAGSENSNPDDIFSVDVWEDNDDEDDGIVYEDVLPGDKLDKVAHVENTGSYDQYIRVAIRVTGANVWQEIFDAEMVPVTEFVDINLEDWYGIGSYLEDNSFVYYLYYNEILKAGESFTVFEHALVPQEMTQQNAALLAGGYEITVTADAVQTENVGENVYEAFQTVNMEIPVNTTFVGTASELKAALNAGGYVVLKANISMKEQLVVEEGAESVLYLDGYTLTTYAVGANNYDVVVKGNLTIEGQGNVVVKGLYGFGTPVGGKGSLTVNGGNFTHNGDYMFGCFDGAIVINDGVFNGNYCIANNFPEYNGAALTGKVTINGGEFNVKATAENIGWSGAAFLGNVKVGNDVEQNYLVSNESELTAALSVGGNIVLTKNVTLKNKLVIEAGVKAVIDLNGKTLTTATVADNYGVVIKGDLTIGGKGNVNVKGLYGFGTSTAGGNLTINGGSFKHEGYYMIGCFGGKVVINDGAFLGSYCILNNFDGYTGKATVNGGSFDLTSTADETGAIFLGNVTDNR